MVCRGQAPNPSGSRLGAFMRYSVKAHMAPHYASAPVAQGIERLPPEQKAAGSNPAGGTTDDLHK